MTVRFGFVALALATVELACGAIPAMAQLRQSPHRPLPDPVALGFGAYCRTGELPFSFEQSYAPPCLVGRRGTPQRRCFNLTGFIPGKTGAEVHAAPDPRSRVVGRILGPKSDEDREWLVGFDIEDSKDGWLKIDHAGDDGGDPGVPDRGNYAGVGWIRGDRVTVTPQASEAFLRPDFARPRAVWADRHDWLDSDLVAVTACDGSWVKAQWKPHRGGAVRHDPAAVVSAAPLIVEGWVTGICDTQETTCDGLNGDRPKH